MEIIYTKNNTFLNEWLNQIDSKVHFIPDNILADALQFIEHNGIPTLKNEAYRHIPIESILKKYFKTLHISTTTTNEQIPSTIPSNHIVLKNGLIEKNLPDKSIQIYTQDDLPAIYQSYIGHTQMHQKDFFAALNTAYCPYFTIIHLTQSLQYPLQITHYIHHIQSNFSQHRLLLICDEGVKAQIFETYHTSQLSMPYLYNFLAEIKISSNSQIQWTSFQKDDSFHLHAIHNVGWNIDTHCRVEHHQISLSAAIWRNNLNMHIQAANTHCELKGLSYGKAQSIISQQTAILHHSGHSSSHQLYKQIVDERSTVLFNGFILVDKDAQKTDAYQHSKNLLLNDSATLFVKPQLEIYADDVKCSHGSSTGALNEDALFYLQSRGIDQQQAQKLLLQAFFYDITQSIQNTDIRQYINNQLEILA